MTPPPRAQNRCRIHRGRMQLREGRTGPGAARPAPSWKRRQGQHQSSGFTCSAAQPDYTETPWRHVIFAHLPNLPFQQKYCEHDDITAAFPRPVI